MKFMNHPYLLAVHPDKSSRALLLSMVEGMKIRVAEANNYRNGVGILERDPNALVLAGASSGDPDVSEFLSFVYRQQPRLPLILLLSGVAPDLASQALRQGAASVLKFPLPTNRLRAAIVQALSQATQNCQDIRSACETRRLAPNPSARRPVETALVGEDPALRQTLELARAISPTCAPVLIAGEAGTGKSLLARIIHEIGPRRNGPFIEVDFEAPREGSLVKELFGGGVELSEGEPLGKVAQARGGTLVLDELTATCPALQLRLRKAFLENQSVTNASTSSPRPDQADIRLILTTRRRGGFPSHGGFWQDLFDRHGTLTLRMPSLAERGPDIQRLSEHFLRRCLPDSRREVVGFTLEALYVLERYSWPGNVAQLKNVIGKAVSRTEDSKIGPAHLDVADCDALPRGLTSQLTGDQIQPLKIALEEPERWLIFRALQATRGNRKEAATLLEIHRVTLDKKMKQYGLFSHCERQHDTPS